jgi:predicted O-methyltransferase YrrM
MIDAVLAATTKSGFAQSCSDGTGRLLAALAATRHDGRIAESGTGFGVGTAWLASALGPAGQLLNVERDPERTAAASLLLKADPRVEVLDEDWTLLRERAPFDLLFCDGGGKHDHPQAVIGLVAPGEILLLDDFTPSFGCPPTYVGPD